MRAHTFPVIPARRALLALFFVAAGAAPVEAQSFSPAAASGDWFVAANWSFPQAVPTASGAAYILTGKTAIVSSAGATAASFSTDGLNTGFQVLSGGTATFGSFSTDSFESGSATILVDGTGSLTSTGTDRLGVTLGTTDFTVSNGGTYSSGALQIAYNSTTTATLSVTSGSHFSTGALSVGYFGQGTLHLDGGSTASASSVDIGSGSSSGAGGSGGVVTVTGSGTTLGVSGNVRIATYSSASSYAQGSLTVADGASMTVGGSISVDHGGTLKIGTGGLGGSLTATGVQFSANEVAAPGVIAFDHTNDLTFAAPITGYGQLTKAGSGNLTLTGANSYAGGTVLTGGSITLGHQNALGNGNITLEGGDLHLAGFTQGFTKLDVQASSSIYLEGVTAIYFTSTTTSWNGTLSLPDFNPATDTLYIAGLAGNQLSQINVPGYLASSDAAGYVSFVAVPEPAAGGVLLGAGLIILALTRRRRAGS